MNTNNYYIFPLAVERKELDIFLPDIAYIVAISEGYNDTIFCLKNNKKYRIRYFTLEKLKHITGFMLQPNKHVLISPDIIDTVEYNVVYLNENIKMNEEGERVHFPLNRAYKKEFLSYLNSKTVS